MQFSDILLTLIEEGEKACSFFFGGGGGRVFGGLVGKLCKTNSVEKWNAKMQMLNWTKKSHIVQLLIYNKLMLATPTKTMKFQSHTSQKFVRASKWTGSTFYPTRKSLCTRNFMYKGRTRSELQSCFYTSYDVRYQRFHTIPLVFIQVIMWDINDSTRMIW